MGKNISDTLGYASCATFLFLPHFDVICDLLLNRRTETWNLLVNSCMPWRKIVHELGQTSTRPQMLLEIFDCFQTCTNNTTYLNILQKGGQTQHVGPNNVVTCLRRDVAIVCRGLRRHGNLNHFEEENTSRA